MNPVDVTEMKHALAGLAETLAAYVRELEAHGFSRPEAMAFAVAWQTEMLSSNRREDS